VSKGVGLATGSRSKATSRSRKGGDVQEGTVEEGNREEGVCACGTNGSGDGEGNRCDTTGIRNDLRNTTVATETDDTAET
jgi:hypothetical protein